MTIEVAIGFRIQGVDKLQTVYCADNPEPTHLAHRAAQLIASRSADELSALARELQMVEFNHAPPTAEELENCKPWSYSGPSPYDSFHSKDSWEYATYHSMGHFDAFKKGLRFLVGRRHMYYMYAFIINCDTQCLEIHSGYISEKRDNGETAVLVPLRLREYYGPHELVANIPFKAVSGLVAPVAFHDLLEIVFERANLSANALYKAHPEKEIKDSEKENVATLVSLVAEKIADDSSYGDYKHLSFSDERVGTPPRMPEKRLRVTYPRVTPRRTLFNRYFVAGVVLGGIAILVLCGLTAA